jgi:glycerol-3-phosphate dehydrogenase (NAD(P)+)
MSKIAVIGTTSWGTTLGIVLARKGMWVRLWCRTEEEAETLEQTRGNQTLLPGISFPRRLSVSANLKGTLSGAALVIMAVPAQKMRENARRIREYIEGSTLVMSAAKGLELGTGLRMSEVIAEEVPSYLHHQICAVSGPNLAREIAQGLPAATVVAARDMEVAQVAGKLLANRHLGVFTNNDIIGVELGGALKNIVALSAGISDGLECGDNAKAALITRGWAEIMALGVALGANPLTFSGLAGLGDLVATSASPLSRNHYVGSELAKGRPLPDILAGMPSVAEGVDTTRIARQLSQKLGVEMPITDLTYRVLFDSLPPAQALNHLLRGVVQPCPELDGLVPSLPAHKR